MFYMYLTTTYFSVYSHLPPFLHPYTPQIKQNLREGKKKKMGKIEDLIMEASCDTVSHVVNPFCVYLCLQVFIAKWHWSESRPLVSATVLILGSHWTSSWISCCWSVLWRYSSFAPVGQVPLCAPADYRSSRCWSGSSHNPSSGPGQQQGCSACEFSWGWEWVNFCFLFLRLGSFPSTCSFLFRYVRVFLYVK